MRYADGMAMTKEQAQEFCSRFETIGKIEAEALRQLTPAEGFRQVALLMQAAHDLGWASRLKEEDEVRKTWILLKEHVG